MIWQEEERIAEEQREAKRLREFFEDYDDERDDVKFYSGSSLQRRFLWLYLFYIDRTTESTTNKLYFAKAAFAEVESVSSMLLQQTVFSFQLSRIVHTM